jgi:hypothetical protein
MPLVIAFLLMLTAFTTIQTETQKIQLSEDVKEVKQSISKLIPVGSRIEEAKDMMEQHGFRCEMKQRDAFVEYDAENKEILHEGEDFLWCDKSKRVAELVVRRWQVIITHKSGIVSGMYVSTGLVAP